MAVHSEIIEPQTARRRYLTPVVTIAMVAIIGLVGLAGWLMQGDPMFMSLAVSGLRGCF